MRTTTAMPCPQWAEKLAMLHPEDLSPAEHEELEAHTATCPSCTAVRAHYNDMAALLNNLPVDGVPTDLPPALTQLWEEEDRPRGSGEIVGFPSKTASPDGTLVSRRKKRIIRLARVIAAVLVVGVLLGYAVTRFSTHNQTGESPGGSFSGSPALIYGDAAVFAQLNVYIYTGRVIAAFHSSNGSLIRTYAIGDGKNSHITPQQPIIAGGVMYVVGTTFPEPGSEGLDSVYALRLSDGALLWHTVVGDLKINPPAIANGISFADGIVYVNINAHSEYLYALRASDGKLLWKFKAGEPYEAEITYPVVVRGVAYAGLYYTQNDVGIHTTQYAYVVALNTKNGQLRWKRKVGVNYINLISVNGVIYAGTPGLVAALRTSDGSTLWQYHTGGSPRFSGRLTVAGGVVYAAFDNGHLYALQVANGRLLWVSNLTNASYISTIIVANGLLYTGGFTGFGNTGGSFIYALSIKNGHLVWRYKVGWNVIPELSYGNGAIYFDAPPQYPTKFYALRASNGTMLWQTTLPM